MAEGSDNGFEERTEDASQHRRDEWRKDGRVAQSRELAAGLALMVTALVMYTMGTTSFKGIWNVFTDGWASMDSYARKDWTFGTVISIFNFFARAFLSIIAPIAIGALVAGVLGSIVQSGFIWTFKPLEPDLEKINPLNGLNKIFSLTGLVEIFKSMFRLVVMGGILYLLLKKWLPESTVLLDMEAGPTASYLGHRVLQLIFFLGLAMLVLSGFDYAFQKFRFENEIKMTKQEAKEERKQLEGNPQIKARIRALQRKISTRKLTDAVKKADVIVTNPTHIAVALLYDRESMFAPKVVAKGADHMAEQIKKIARENGIPLVENVPLARSLYKSFKMGQFISREFFNGVAEVLAFVYRLKGKSL